MCMCAEDPDRYRACGRYSIGLLLRATPRAHGEDLGIRGSEVLGTLKQISLSKLYLYIPIVMLVFSGLD